MIDKKNILGVGITNATKKEILEYTVKNIENFRKKLFFVTPNPEFLVLASKNFTFKNILNKADLALMDGIGILLAAKILGKSLKERFPGVDLVKSLCKQIVRKPITVGFLGGKEGVAEKTAECLQKKYPGLKVGFVGSKWPVARGPALPAEALAKAGPAARSSKGAPSSLSSSNEDARLWNPRLSSRRTPSSIPPLGSPAGYNHKSSIINHKSIDILFVAFGAPKQEIWINENLQKIPVKIAIGVGGAFDYISGRVPRAPDFIQKLGFEWLFRLIRQPWRVKRQLALLEFMYLVLKEKVTSKNII